MRFAAPSRLRGLASWSTARRPEFMWLGALIAVAALSLVFGWLAEEVIEGDTKAFDRHILLMFRAPGDPATLVGPAWLPEMLRDLTSLGSTVVLGLVFVTVLGYLLMANKRAAAILVFASVLGGQVLSTVLKLAFARPRPHLVPDAPDVFTASFPSGHAMLSAITYLTLAALLARIEMRRAIRRYIMGVGVFLTVMIGTSRIVLGVHWPTDVLAGWCVGAAWAVFCAAIALWIARRGDVERLA